MTYAMTLEAEKTSTSKYQVCMMGFGVLPPCHAAPVPPAGHEGEPYATQGPKPCSWAAALQDLEGPSQVIPTAY